MTYEKSSQWNDANCGEELPEKPVGQQITDRLPTGYQQATDS